MIRPVKETGRVAKDRALLLSLGRRIAEARRAKGLTQAEVARRAGLTTRYISMVETGRRNPTFLVLNDIARGGLGAAPGPLLGLK